MPNRQFCKTLFEEIQSTCTEQNLMSCSREHLMQSEQTKECAVDALVLVHAKHAVDLSGRKALGLASDYVSAAWQ